MAVSHVKSNTIGDFTGTVTVMNSQGSSTTAAATDLVRPVDWNSAHNQYYTLSGNTGNASTASGTNVVLQGGAGIRMQGSTGTIVVDQMPLSQYSNIYYPFNTQSQQNLQSTFGVFPFKVDEPLSFDMIRLAHTISKASSSFGSTLNTTLSMNWAASVRLMLLSRLTGASSQSLGTVYTSQHEIKHSWNMAMGAATANGQSHSIGWTFPQSNTTQLTRSDSYQATNASFQMSTTASATAFTGAKFLEMPFAGSLTPGEYWLAVNLSTAITTQGTNMSGVAIRLSTYGISLPNLTFGRFAEANNASVQMLSGVGSFTTVGGATTGSMGFSNISSSASHLVPIMGLHRTTN